MTNHEDVRDARQVLADYKRMLAFDARLVPQVKTVLLDNSPLSGCMSPYICDVVNGLGSVLFNGCLDATREHLRSLARELDNNIVELTTLRDEIREVLK